MLRKGMSISNELQMFSVCECSCCKQKKCTKDKKDFEYPKCNRKTTRLFEIDLIDGTALATTSISGVLGEKLFFVTAENIFDITCIKLRNSSLGNSNTTHTTLSVLSYVQKEQTLTPSTTERDSKKIKPLGISEVISCEDSVSVLRIRRHNGYFIFPFLLFF
ncbi:uncharacterized protein [Solanum tuberosum]|uniref:uncharacterized protein isoform X2 n=1 Tax=Solanum tuberosum TaxID=4113 RepID=UPI00073A16FB|nr:PREDICTED: uncharacterized protein LOC102597406 isoform X2 [Solanum tuberosum]